MATKTILIHETPFEITAPYAAGHTITEAEARSLNQTRAENIGNNFRKRIKEATANGGDLNAIRAELQQYDAQYNFSMGGGTPRTPVDPVEREARSLAKTWLTAKLAEKGQKLKDLSEEQVDNYMEKLVANKDILALAKKKVADKKRVAAISLEDMGLGAQ